MCVIPVKGFYFSQPERVAVRSALTALLDQHPDHADRKRLLDVIDKLDGNLTIRDLPSNREEYMPIGDARERHAINRFLESRGIPPR